MTETAREALGPELTRVMRGGQAARALRLARVVLRENALKLYGLPAAPAGQ